MLFELDFGAAAWAAWGIFSVFFFFCFAISDSFSSEENT